MAGYVYKDKPAGWPHDPATHDPDSEPMTFAESSAERKRRRLEHLKTLQAVRPPLSRSDMARRLGVSRRTLIAYQGELAARARQDENVCESCAAGSACPVCAQREDAS
jgi:DNA-binding XRE family transcriptional regulator